MEGGGRPIRISDLFRISDFGLRILAALGGDKSKPGLDRHWSFVICHLSLAIGLPPLPSALKSAKAVMR
jgi:hypothetical protein